MTKEYEEILSWHPQLVLISTKPVVTWRGFLNINSLTQIEIVLKVPKYPQLEDACIKFDSKVHLMSSNNFAEEINTLLNNSTSVLSFLNQLRTVMNNILKDKSDEYNINFHWCDTKSLEELQNILLMPGITVFVDRDFSVIKLTSNDISIQLKHSSTGNSSWVVVSSDLPQLKGWEALDNYVTNLSEAANILRTRVEALEDTWHNLKTIDENCWVVDPINPKPYHLYRRIHLSASLSLLITLNPLNPQLFQEIKPLGSDSEVAKCQETINQNIKKWSDNSTILDNLLELLNLSELPQPPIIKNDINTNNGLVSEEECCICFCLESDDGEIPSEICDNNKCQRNFHTSCLYQWLTAVVGNQLVFNRIHGTCPNCNGNISCRIVSK